MAKQGFNFNPTALAEDMEDQSMMGVGRPTLKKRGGAAQPPSSQPSILQPIQTPMGGPMLPSPDPAMMAQPQDTFGGMKGGGMAQGGGDEQDVLAVLASLLGK